MFKSILSSDDFSCHDDGVNSGDEASPEERLKVSIRVNDFETATKIAAEMDQPLGDLVKLAIVTYFKDFENEQESDLEALFNFYYTHIEKDGNVLREELRTIISEEFESDGLGNFEIYLKLYEKFVIDGEKEMFLTTAWLVYEFVATSSLSSHKVDIKMLLDDSVSALFMLNFVQRKSYRGRAPKNIKILRKATYCRAEELLAEAVNDSNVQLAEKAAILMGGTLKEVIEKKMADCFEARIFERSDDLPLCFSDLVCFYAENFVEKDPEQFVRGSEMAQEIIEENLQWYDFVFSRDDVGQEVYEKMVVVTHHLKNFSKIMFGYYSCQLPQRSALRSLDGFVSACHDGIMLFPKSDIRLCQFVAKKCASQPGMRIRDAMRLIEGEHKVWFNNMRDSIDSNGLLSYSFPKERVRNRYPRFSVPHKHLRVRDGQKDLLQYLKQTSASMFVMAPFDKFIYAIASSNTNLNEIIGMFRPEFLLKIHDGKTVLYIAVQEKRVDVVGFLVNAGRQLNKDVLKEMLNCPNGSQKQSVIDLAKEKYAEDNDNESGSMLKSIQFAINSCKAPVLKFD